MNILLLIKNHILKILGPFGFQESGSLSFDHIIDFHDYITLYLIFIFVLVMWVLVYSINIVLFPRFVTLFVSLWHGSYIFSRALTLVLLFAYNKFDIINQMLYKRIVVLNNSVCNLYRFILEHLDFNEGDEDEFEKTLSTTYFSASYYVFVNGIQVVQFLFNLAFFMFKELFIMLVKEYVQPYLIRFNSLKLSIRRIKYLKRKKKTRISFVSLNKYCGLGTPKDIWFMFYNLFYFAFLHIFSNFLFGFIFFREQRHLIRFFKRQIYFASRIIMRYNIIFARIIRLLNNGSPTVTPKTLRKFYDNMKDFINSRRNIIRFARRITHASTLEIVWTIFPSIILLLIAVPSLILLYELDAVAPVSLGVKIIGRQWYWSYSIGSSFPIFKDLITLNLPEFSNWDSYMVADETSHLRLLEVDNPLFLPAGIPITLFITASDVIHSWAVPALGIKVDAIPGRLNQVSFTIYDTGVFYGQCSELCGVNHGFMPIQIISLVDNSHLIH